MSEKTYESCSSCANIHNCSGPDYIDGSCYPGYKPIEQNTKDKQKSNTHQLYTQKKNQK